MIGLVSFIRRGRETRVSPTTHVHTKLTKENTAPSHHLQARKSTLAKITSASTLIMDFQHPEQ